MSGDKVKTGKRANALLRWFAREARNLPWRRNRHAYGVWISEIMLQQTQVKTVIRYWERWMTVLPDIRALARAKLDLLYKLWEGLGYYSRVRNVQKAAQMLLNDYHGRFPEEFDRVLELPGIGRYTAGAICSIAFNQPHPILDGNVIRVLTRVYGLEGDPRGKALNQQLWALAEEWVKAAPGRYGELNESLMELGALVCLPRAPRCNGCPLRKTCVAQRTGRTGELPGIRRRVPVTPRWFAAFVIRRNGRFLVVQRPHNAVNGNLWEFPNAELSRRAATDGVRLLIPHTPSNLVFSCIRLKSPTPICTIKHSITRYRITLEAYEADAASVSAQAARQGRWLTLADMEKLAFTSAHKKILNSVRDSTPEEK